MFSGSCTPRHFLVFEAPAPHTALFSQEPCSKTLQTPSHTQGQDAAAREVSLQLWGIIKDEQGRVLLRDSLFQKQPVGWPGKEFHSLILLPNVCPEPTRSGVFSSVVYSRGHLQHCHPVPKNKTTKVLGSPLSGCPGRREQGARALQNRSPLFTL